MDGLDFRIESLGNFEFGSLIDFYKDSKYIEFYTGNLLYNPEDVDINNMQIYLVDKETQNETLIYSK